MEPKTAGDPITGRRWVRITLRSLAHKLRRGRRARASRSTIARLLHKQGIRLRANRKRFTGPSHPDRDRQFQYIQFQRELFHQAEQPAISVDTKKKELIGNFRNAGRTWRRAADEVLAHDFPQDAECRATPYGIYDTRTARGHVVVGTSCDTPKFAVDSLRQWWRREGSACYPEAEHLLIEADGGGSNGCRPRLWKAELQRFADETGLEITVCHYPTGASKWNPIEHRLFSRISQTWAGIPLRTLPRMLVCLRATTTTGGRVTATLIHRRYRTGQRVSAAEMKQLKVEHHGTCPNWNYTIIPRRALRNNNSEK